MEPSKQQKGKEKNRHYADDYTGRESRSLPGCMPRSRRESDAKCMFSEFEAIDVDVAEKEDRELLVLRR